MFTLISALKRVAELSRLKQPDRLCIILAEELPEDAEPDDEDWLMDYLGVDSPVILLDR